MPSFYKGDNMKKVISLFLMIVMLMPLCLSAVAAEPEIVNTYEISDTTSIAEDFEIAFGGKYKIEDFPFDESVGGSPKDDDDIFLINCVEHNYSDRTKFQMYLYVYNPTKKAIDFESSGNKISLLSNVTGLNRKSHELQLVGQEGDGLLLKFKIADWKENLIPGIEERYYEFSELELKSATAQEGEATAYTVATAYTFRENELGFLVQLSEETEVVVTTVQHSYYRYQSDEYNKYCDLRSVYFNVPNSVIEEYGEMEAIRAEWEECKLYPIIVTDNEEAADVFSNMILNKRITDKNKMMFFYDYSSYWGSFLGVLYNYVFCNFDESEKPFTIDSANSLVKYLGGSFYRENIDDPGKVVISAADLKARIDSTYGWYDYCFMSINRDNFGDNVKWFDVYESVELDKYSIPETALQIFKATWLRLAFEKDGENVETFTPLRKVNPEDFNLSKEEFSYKYKIAVEDFENIKKAQEVDKTMYILSYTATEYNVYNDVRVVETSDALSSVEGEFDWFVADVVGIRNFDLIEAKYVKDGVTTIIPFVSSRTNAVPGITTPNVPKGSCEDIVQLINTIIIALIILVTLVLIIRIVSYIKRKRRERAIDKRLFKK